MQHVLTALAVEDPIATTESYFFRMFSPFCRLFLTFSDGKLLL